MDAVTFLTSGPCLRRAVVWIDRRNEPGITLVAIEGTNSYGDGLARVLQTTDLEACEVRPPRRTSRAGRGKSDEIDALAAASTVLGADVEVLLEPRAASNREALRILLNARTVIERQGTADRLMLTSMLRTMDLGVDARRALTDEQVLHINRWRARRDDDLWTGIARAEAKRLAEAIVQSRAQLEANHRQLQEVVGIMAAGLLELYGVSPVSAAQVLISYSHHGRVRSEAAFAALAGVNPIPVSSGNKTRYRLNRHGDRQLNKAIHTIARSRMAFDAATIDYVERRTAEGKTLRDIRRCIKQFIARQLFRQLRTLLT